jgi:hypothetical protein
MDTKQIQFQVEIGISPQKWEQKIYIAQPTGQEILPKQKPAKRRESIS